MKEEQREIRIPYHITNEEKEMLLKPVSPEKNFTKTKWALVALTIAAFIVLLV